jgi:hypothetical protein
MTATDRSETLRLAAEVKLRYESSTFDPDEALKIRTNGVTDSSQVLLDVVQRLADTIHGGDWRAQQSSMHDAS